MVQNLIIHQKRPLLSEKATALVVCSSVIIDFYLSFFRQVVVGIMIVLSQNQTWKLLDVFVFTVSDSMAHVTPETMACILSHTTISVGSDQSSQFS